MSDQAYPFPHQRLDVYRVALQLARQSKGLAFFRGVTQRSEERRQTPWKTVSRWVYNMLIAAQPADLEGLRDRKMALAGV